MTNTEKTKIIATIGPACENEDILEKMILSGVDFLRLNFSHNTHSWHAKTIEKIRKIEKRVNKLVPIIADIQGPKIRIGTLPEQGLEIKNGQKIFIDCRANECNNNLIPLPSKLIEEGTKKDDTLYLDDGTIHIQIEKKDKNILRAIVLKGGMLFSKKGVNAPNLRITSPILNLKDISDIKFAIENKVDYVAISFLRNAKDVQEARKILEKTNIKIISKIERHEALVNIKEITDASDIIMVARGDLGIETPLWELPIRQKEIIDLAKGEQKPVVVATQMLDSMIRNPLPTRAEVSDVANAVFDSADAVMLSGETAIGKYPLEAVSMMKKIIDATYQKRDLICKMKSRICK